MNKEWAEKWAAALRSGEYKQGTGRLRQGDRFCCLGVTDRALQHSLQLQARLHAQQITDLSHPMRVLWQVKPDGTRVLWLSPAGPAPGPASFYRRPTLGDCLLGEVRL